MTKQLTLENVQEAQELFEKLENDLAILLQGKEKQIKADLSSRRDALSEAYDEAGENFILAAFCSIWLALPLNLTNWTRRSRNSINSKKESREGRLS